MHMKIQTDVFDLLDDAESKLFEITNNHLRKNFDTIDSVLVKTIQRIEDLRHKNEDVTGVPSGFPSLDRVTYGWQNYRSDHPGCTVLRLVKQHLH